MTGELTVKDNRCVWSNEYGTCTSTTSGSSGTLGVYGDITAYDNSIASIPRTRLDPVNGIEKCSCSAVASVLGINTLDVEVARLGEEVHEGCLNRLGLVDDGFGANVNSTNGCGVNVVFFEETGHS
jgi:hypothetical protein